MKPADGTNTNADPNPAPAAPASTPAPAAKPAPAPAVKPAPPKAAPKTTTKTPPGTKPANLPTPASDNEGDIALTYYPADDRSYLLEENQNHPHPWEVDCSMFAWEVALRAGYDINRGTAVDQSNWYKRHGHWSSNIADAQKGDHIFWSRGKGKYHTGIVTDVRVVGKTRVVYVMQSQTFGHKPHSIRPQHTQPDGSIHGFGQPFVGVGRYP